MCNLQIPDKLRKNILYTQNCTSFVVDCRHLVDCERSTTDCESFKVEFFIDRKLPFRI